VCLSTTLRHRTTKTTFPTRRQWHPRAQNCHASQGVQTRTRHPHNPLQATGRSACRSCSVDRERAGPEAPPASYEPTDRDMVLCSLCSFVFLFTAVNGRIRVAHPHVVVRRRTAGTPMLKVRRHLSEQAARIFRAMHRCARSPGPRSRIQQSIRAIAAAATATPSPAQRRHTPSCTPHTSIHVQNDGEPRARAMPSVSAPSWGIW
jgi:hypothetical protein